jgi:hypothetical protein
MKRVAIALGVLVGAVVVSGCGAANYRNQRLIYGMPAYLFEPEMCEPGMGGAGTAGAGQSETAPLEVKQNEQPQRSSPPMQGGSPGMRIIIENERVVGG